MLGSGLSKKNVGSEKHENYDPSIPKKDRVIVVTGFNCKPLKGSCASLPAALESAP